MAEARFCDDVSTPSSIHSRSWASGSQILVSALRSPENLHQESIFAMSLQGSVWVELVIDGKSNRPFKVVVKPRDDVDDLMEAIMVKAKYLFDEDIHSLEVHPPGIEAYRYDHGTDSLLPGLLLTHGTNDSLLPGLLLSDPDFPSGITHLTPLIVDAQSRQQPQQQPATTTNEQQQPPAPTTSRRRPRQPPRKVS
jgi:hypothetical protein